MLTFLFRDEDNLLGIDNGYVHGYFQRNGIALSFTRQKEEKKILFSYFLFRLHYADVLRLDAQQNIVGGL